MSLQRTHICFVLDRSGSMARIQESIIKGVNEQITEIRKDAETNADKNETLVSFYTFNHKVEPKYHNISVNLLEDLTEREYEIGGDTAVYDAVGQAIDDYEKSTDTNDENSSYLIFVVSDGAERCSKKYTRTALAEKIKKCQDSKRWTFTYLGANQNLSKLAKELAVPVGNFGSYAADARSTDFAMAGNAKNLGKFLRARACGVQQTNTFHSEKGVADYTTSEVPSGNRVKAIWQKPKT